MAFFALLVFPSTSVRIIAEWTLYKWFNDLAIFVLCVTEYQCQQLNPSVRSRQASVRATQDFPGRACRLHPTPATQKGTQTTHSRHVQVHLSCNLRLLSSSHFIYFYWICITFGDVFFLAPLAVESFHEIKYTAKCAFMTVWINGYT